MSAEPASRAPDPYLAFLFSVEVAPPGGPTRPGAATTVVGFSEVSGLTFETDVESIKVGGIEGDVLLPGPAKPPPRLVLRRGLADRSTFWQWYRDVMRGKIQRRPVTVSLHGPDGAVRQSWQFVDACPVKWQGPDLRASSSAIGFESIEMIHRGLQASSD